MSLKWEDLLTTSDLYYCINSSFLLITAIQCLTWLMLFSTFWFIISITLSNTVDLVCPKTVYLVLAKMESLRNWWLSILILSSEDIDSVQGHFLSGSRAQYLSDHLFIFGAFAVWGNVIYINKWMISILFEQKSSKKNNVNIYWVLLHELPSSWYGRH